MHYIKECIKCNKVIEQCRCMDANKQIIYSICPECEEKKNNVVEEKYTITEFKEKFLKNSKNCPPEFIELVNKHFWELF